MLKKIGILLLLILFITLFSFHILATNETMMGNAKNNMASAGNSLANAAVSTKNAVVAGAKDIGNGLSNLGKDASNTMQNMGNSIGNATSSLRTDNGNYTATQTATTNNNAFGLSNTAWTWLILGIVGLAIVGLVWYYGAQYEHKNYDHE